MNSMFSVLNGWGWYPALVFLFLFSLPCSISAAKQPASGKKKDSAEAASTDNPKTGAISGDEDENPSGTNPQAGQSGTDLKPDNPSSKGKDKKKSKSKDGKAVQSGTASTASPGVTGAGPSGVASPAPVVPWLEVVATEYVKSEESIRKFSLPPKGTIAQTTTNISAQEETGGNDTPPKAPEKPKEPASTKKNTPSDTAKPAKETKPEVVTSTVPQAPEPVVKPETKRETGKAKPPANQPEAAPPASPKKEVPAPVPAKTAAKPAPAPESPKLKSTDGKVMNWSIRRIGQRDYVTFDDINKFYHFQSMTKDKGLIWLRSPSLVIKAKLDGLDLIINNVKFILSYPVVEIGGEMLLSRMDLCKMLDPILRPSYINSKQFSTIIIDPGHGGSDSGAKGAYGMEKDFTLLMAYQVRQELAKQGFQVVLTREKDEYISLGERVRRANLIPNSIFVSLHFNSGEHSVRGIETYALSPQGTSSVYGSRETDFIEVTGNLRDSENIALATAIHASVMHVIPTVDRGVKRARWHVLTGLEKPGVLFEGGFVTNREECFNISNAAHRQNIALAIVAAIVNYRNALKRR